MKIKEQFEKSANSYEVNSKVQFFGAKHIVNELKSPIGNIADLGCGSGRVYKELTNSSYIYNRFYAIDFAKNMLNLHPKGKNVELIEGDFNSSDTFKHLESLNLDTIVSASALQWAKNLDATLSACAKCAKEGVFLIFSSNTFKSLHECGEIDSPIYSKDDIIKSFKKSYNAKKIEQFNYNLEFNTTLEMLSYIKKSGVSGGLNIGYKKIKHIIDNYPLNYLEFETILLVGDSITKD
jgi:malonyl-CoA O-methyltransferase